MSVSRSLKAMGGKHGLIRAIKLHSREHYKTLVSSAMLTRQSIITMQLHSVHKYTIRLPLKNISVLLILLLCLCGMISCFGEGYVTHIAWCGILDDGLWPGCRLTLCFPVACFVYSTVDIFITYYVYIKLKISRSLYSSILFMLTVMKHEWESIINCPETSKINLLRIDIYLWDLPPIENERNQIVKSDHHDGKTRNWCKRWFGLFIILKSF